MMMAKNPILQIGMQYGVGAGDCAELSRCHYSLNSFFERHDVSDYLDFYSGLAILGRVAGGSINFGGGEGPERLRTDRERTMILDLVIPERAWRNKSPEDVRVFFSKGFRECMIIFANKASSKQRLVDEKGFLSLLEEAIETLR